MKHDVFKYELKYSYSMRTIEFDKLVSAQPI